MSIQSDEIELKPLTILTGPNSSGKSNIIQSIAIISQIARASPSNSWSFPEHLENEMAEYYKYPKPSIGFIVHKGELEREIAIEIHISSGISKRSIGYSVKYASDESKTEQTLFLNQRPIFRVSHITSKEFQQSTFRRPKRWIGESPQQYAQFLLRPECFAPSEDAIKRKSKSTDRALGARLRKTAYSLTNELVKELGRIYLISAPRGIIPIKTEAGPDPARVGKNGENLIYILSKIYGKSKYKSIQQKISDWSEKFGIGNIGAGVQKGSVLGADFEDPTLRTIFDMKLASYGSRQLLTIITQIFWSNSGDTSLIEEPEISLHPQSQVLIQELFAEAVSDGKQIICTTHSPFFILSLSRVIGKEMLSTNDVAVYHVEKGLKGTKARRLELNDRGFIKGYIPSYMDIENKLFNEWVEGIE